jgi:hypothetical protein
MDDVQAIKNIVLSYVELLDVGDLDGLSNLFARATVHTPGATALRGAEAFKEFIDNGVQFYDGIPSTKHVVSNVIVEIDDERNTARARSYYTAFQARPELPLQPILAGRFHDRLERGHDGWHIVERVIYADLFGDLRYHVQGIPQSVPPPLDATEEQLAAIEQMHRQFTTNGIEYWLFGGWAVDFHAGRVTRAHADIDLAVWRADVERIA